ncbi:MAG: hypothetical protein MUD14_09225 [Hydrococcus sp. Prado102]|jgi:hypothetical protein|nr:hypothetical protein [Hydrococcus sp. Prado102]
MDKILGWLRGGLNLLIFAVFLLLLWGTLAPVGTLVWWLEKGGKELEEDIGELVERNDRDPRSASANKNVRCYIVFLTGVGDMSADQLASGEEKFLDLLEQDHPNCVTVREVFPYSAANQDIGGQPVFEFLWEISQEAQGWLEVTDYLLEIRNLWRMAISADNRYGEIYNRAIALTIFQQMEKQQPISYSSDEPIELILMGTSGGVQIALGATPYLKQWLPVEITVVSFGGVFNGNEGFDAAQHVYHFRGDRDWIEPIGGIIFPSRWRWTVGSPYNRARRQDRYTSIDSGSHEHNGDEGYFGQHKAENGKTYLELTVEQVNRLPILPE